MAETTIVLADDHPVVRRGLMALLEREQGFRIVGEATGGLEALRLIEQLSPRVAVVDLMMPGMNGLEVARQASKSAPATRVVILSMYANEAYVVDALRSGAFGYVLKDSSEVHLIHAIREADEGRRYLSPSISERVLDAYLEWMNARGMDPYETLSSREREVLQLCAEGASSVEISARFQISARTVEGHRFNLMHKLGLRTQVDLIRYALRRGIIPPE